MCRDVGLCYFVERDQSVLKLSVDGNIETYEIMRIVDFNSTDKRMSVVVKDQQNDKVHSFVKGADDKIKELLGDSNEVQDEQMIESINSYASMGYRTLMFAKKELPVLKTTEMIKNDDRETFESDL